MTPMQLSLEQANAMASYIREYWRTHGATVKVIARADTRMGYSVTVLLGPDGLPTRWERHGQRAAYINQAIHTWQALLEYLNKKILPPHNKLSREAAIG